jgi:hypothetical protein
MRSPNPVALLEAALALAIQLLIARHPDLLLPDDVPRLHPPPALRSARAIVALGNAMLAELARYDALDLRLPCAATADPDGIPF